MQFRSPQSTSYLQRRSRLNGSPRRFMLLGPSNSPALHRFPHARHDRTLFEEKLAETQRLRGGVYLRLGAIEASQLTPGGRHQVSIDDESWHLLVQDHDGQVCGCLRYHEHSKEASFSDLGLSRSEVVGCPRWGSVLKAAVEDELAIARLMDLPYVEVGGWALLEALHRTGEALRMALVMYALARRLGGAVGITTANNGNCSASILRRIGGHPLERGRRTVPPFFDPQYQREIDILRFYSWAPNPRYAACIEELEEELLALPVLTSGAPAIERPRAMRAAAGWSRYTVSTADSRY